jgi:hypothetical protein
MSAELAQVLADRPYPSDVRLRCSTLKAMGRSPAHCLHAMRSPYEPTVAMRLGSGAHSLLLGGQDIATFTGKVRRGKEWADFCDAHPNDLILNEQESETAHAIADAVKADPIAQRVLYQPGTIYERTIEWDWEGRPFRCTPDARGPFHLVDLKTTRDAEPEAFQRQAIKLGYHAQLALYALAIEQATGVRPRDVYIVAVESKPPHAVTVLELTPRALEAGEKLCRRWLDRFKECQASGEWPGYTTSLVTFDVLPSMDEFTFDDDDNNDEEQA